MACLHRRQGKQTNFAKREKYITFAIRSERTPDCMVDVAQLVRVTDCGSEGRGFESHLPPSKVSEKETFFVYLLLIRMYRLLCHYMPRMMTLPTQYCQHAGNAIRMP